MHPTIACEHCQPSEEKEHKKGYYMSGEGYYNEKGQHISEAEYYSFITARGTSEEKECSNCRHFPNAQILIDEQGKCVVCDREITTRLTEVKPNSTALEWEEQIRGLATDSGPGDKDEIIKIVKELLSFQQEEILNDLLKNGYGGGNYRRLILDKLSRRV